MMQNPEKLLDLLFQDARLTPAQLAAMTGESEQDVAAAIRAFEKNDTILGYKTVIDWDKTAKESVTALIEVKITPQKGMGFDEIARQIYSHHQVESVYLMSGGFDLTVIITGRSMREVARFVSEQLAPMENVLSTGTHFILKKYKENGVEYDPSATDKREVMMAW
jgi:DNA-binding Lrp family transcriptional regulator